MLRTTLGGAAPLLAAALLLSACSDPDPTPPAPETSAATSSPTNPDGAGEGGTGDDTAATGSTAAATTLDLGAEVQPDGTVLVDGEQASFLMPSANLVCVLRPGSVVCQIHEKNFTPRQADLAPDVAEGCTRQDADGLVIRDGEAARWTCLPEDLRGWASVDTGGSWVGRGIGSTRELGGTAHAVLPYGTTLRLADVACESRRDGVECSDLSTGRSLHLAREGYRTG